MSVSQLDEACRSYFDRSKAACKEHFYSSVQKPAQACWNCGVKLTLEKVKKCSKCHLAVYCGQDCQRRDWEVHRQPEGCTAFSEKFARLKKFYSVPSTAKDLSENRKKIEAEFSRIQKAFSKATEVVRGQEDLLKRLEAVKDLSVSRGDPQAALLIANFEQASQQLDSYKQNMNEMQKQIEMQIKMYTKTRASASNV